jgi:Leucine-rich repeat (LRR) protein
LNDNKVTCLPEDIAECISLKLLDLSHNPKLDALPFCIADLPITYLNLTGTSVTVLPEEMEYRVKASMLRLEGFTGKFIIPNLLSLKGNFCGIN